jgi:hypothetical protein
MTGKFKSSSSHYTSVAESMIYLRKPNLLFLKPTKVAGTSFEVALSRFAGPKDIITSFSSSQDEAARKKLGYRGPQNHRYSFRETWGLSRTQKLKALLKIQPPVKFTQHISAQQARERLGARVFDTATRISIIRNPFDQLVSYYYWRMKNREVWPQFRDWLRAFPHLIGKNNRFYYIEDKPVIDIPLRFEDIETDISRLEKTYPELDGLLETFSALRFKSAPRPPGKRAQDFFKFDPDLIEVVRFFNQRLMDDFGYRLEDTCTKGAESFGDR